MPPEAPMSITEYIQAVERLREEHGFFAIELDFGTLMCMISTIQLALRHPRNNGPTAGMMKAMVEDIITSIESSEPELAAFLRLGFDSTSDVPW